MRQILAVNTGDRVHAAALAARSDLKVTFVTEERFVNMYPSNTDIVVVENLNDPSSATKSVVMQRDCNNYEAVVSLLIVQFLFYSFQVHQVTEHLIHRVYRNNLQTHNFYEYYPKWQQYNHDEF